MGAGALTDLARYLCRLVEVITKFWLGGRDSNPDTQIQSLQSYH
jgi:hypothetical protein